MPDESWRFSLRCQKSCARLLCGLCVVALCVASGLSGQLSAQHPIERNDWTVQMLRPSGQPVIPMFEGWYENPDGTRDLCFGYYTANTEQVLDIPLGPANYIEPRSFDGAQPTHFMPAMPTRGYRRYWCVFTVKVARESSDPVVWTLVVNGHQYSARGHTGSRSYILDEPDTKSNGGNVAPVVRLEPDGPEGRGRNGIWAKPLTVRVNEPLPLTATVTHPSGQSTRWWLGWTKHQGSGLVNFESQEIRLAPGESKANTSVIFREPGDYVLRAQALDSPNPTFEFHCCWTNAFVPVRVVR